MNPLLRLDLEGFRAIHVRLNSPVLDPVMWAFSYSGLGQVQALGAALFLLSARTKHYVLPLFVTILVAGLPVAQLIKRLLPRQRPSNLFFSRPQEEFFANSFPSGHTTTAFAVATMLFLITRGSRNEWLGRLAIPWALMVGISRIYRGVHWPTDVLAGMCAGVFAACAVYLMLHKLGRQLHLDEPSATLSGEHAEPKR